MLTAQRYEQAFMDAASWYMDLAEEIVEDSGSYTVRSMRKKGFDVSDFKDVRMAQEDYELEAFPISLLPSTPAGRIQTVQELINMGVIDSKEQITKLLDYPDLASVTHWMEAAENDIEWRISQDPRRRGTGCSGFLHEPGVCQVENADGISGSNAARR